MSEKSLSKSKDYHEQALSEKIESPKDEGLNKSFEN